MQENQKETMPPSAFGLSRRHQMIVIGLLAVILAAVIGHFIFRPDRNAALKIVYSGDIQGQIAYEGGLYAGYEKIAAIAREAANDGSDVLLLDTGNCLGGNEAAEMDDGRSIIALMNAAGYDAMVPGPLDFIYGADTLSSLRAEAGFPFLAANIKKADGSNAFENYKILNINSVRIGIVGVTTGINQVQAARDGLVVEDPVEAVKDVMQQLYGRTDAMIVLAYTGDDEVTEALADIKGVSLVIESGHAEDFSDITESGAMIACAGRGGSVIGVASIEIRRDQSEIDNVFYQSAMYDGLTSDDTVVQALENVKQNRSSAGGMQVGSVHFSVSETETDIETDIETETDEISVSESETDEIPVEADVVYHNAETATGNLTADAMLDATVGDGAAVALIEDRSIQGELRSGSVSRGQIDALFDDNLYLVTCKMTGGELRSALEESFSGYPSAEGFLQVSGMTCTYDAGTGIGSNLSEIVIAGHAIDDARTYIVAMTNSLADELGYVSETSGRVSNYKTIASVLTGYIEKQTVNASQAVPETGETETGGSVQETEETKRITIIE